MVISLPANQWWYHGDTMGIYLDTWCCEWDEIAKIDRPSVNYPWTQFTPQRWPWISGDREKLGASWDEVLRSVAVDPSSTPQHRPLPRPSIALRTPSKWALVQEPPGPPISIIFHLQLSHLLGFLRVALHMSLGAAIQIGSDMSRLPIWGPRMVELQWGSPVTCS